MAFQGGAYPPPAFPNQGGPENCNCVAAPEGASAALSLVARTPSAQPGGGVQVDVFMEPTRELSGYEVFLDVAGGNGGSLLLTGVTIDESRPDYVFASLKSLKVMSVDQGRLINVVMGSGIAVTDRAYLGTFTYLPRDGATGAFDVTVRGGGASFVLDSLGRAGAIEPSSCTVDATGVDCRSDSDCNDRNDCTIDACRQNRCVITDRPAGASCDDGAFCTLLDVCDGSGHCVGRGGSCAWGESCCEFTDECKPPGGECQLP